MPRAKVGLSGFELYVMLALARLGAQAYGASIRREIEQRAGRDVAIGAVYATVGRLEEKGYVGSYVSPPVPVRGGRSRRHYQLRPAGERALDESLAMLRRMASGLRRRPAGGGA